MYITFYWSWIRDSNRQRHLGRVKCYHYTNTAYKWWFSSLPQISMTCPYLIGLILPDLSTTKHFCSKAVFFWLPQTILGTLFFLVAPDLKGTSDGRYPKWSWIRDSNPWPRDYKSRALPTELIQHKMVPNLWVEHRTSQLLAIVVSPAPTSSD